MLPPEGFRSAALKFVALLDRFEIRFHLTGGIASIAYGEPRLTQDVDLVVDAKRLREVQPDFLAAASRAGFLFDEAAVDRAIASNRMFQLLDPDQVIKLDVYPRALIPGELERSVRTELFPGVVLPLVARADAALSKLIWIDHGSHRSRRDLRQILAGASSEEMAAVRRIAHDMNLADLLDSVLAESDEIDA